MLSRDLEDRPHRRTASTSLRLSLSAGLALASLSGLASGQTDLAEVGALHAPAAEHILQSELADLVDQGMQLEAFLRAFDHGDELFEFEYNALDGGGANVGNGERWTRMPRADRNGPGEWANHVPMRATGPNGNSCVQCHFQPVADGAGLPSSNVHRDPFHTGDVGQMIQRQTPHVHGSAALQLLAEEMTRELSDIRDRALKRAHHTKRPVIVRLRSKGVDFGRIRVRPDGHVNLSQVEGLDGDLVVKPFQWKGNFLTMRDFNNDATHNELGMQGVEIAGDGIDGDYDGVVDELTIGDLTALTIYLAAQPRPTSLSELGMYGLAPERSPAELAKIEDGKVAFDAAGCAHCHVPAMTLENTVFTEPSQHPAYRRDVLPAGQVAADRDLDPARAVSFDITTDLPDNIVEDDMGNELAHLGVFETDAYGNAIVRLYGDLKRHDMGPGLAEDIDETGSGASVFLTENLWGVGGTAPYLHDGRATTITEAIQWHGGEAAKSRHAFQYLLTDYEREALVAFLEDLTLALFPEEEE